MAPSVAFKLVDTIRDFKRFTYNQLIEQINNEPESRRDWLLDQFQFAVRRHPKNKNYKIWQDGNHAIEIFSEKIVWQKLNYIHRNPVVDKIVYKEEDYLFSSAHNYYNLPFLLPVDCLTLPVITSSDRNFLNC